MPTPASLLRAVTLVFALREYLIGSTPPKAGVEAQDVDGKLRFREEGNSLDSIDEEDEEKIEQAQVEDGFAVRHADEGSPPDAGIRSGDAKSTLGVKLERMDTASLLAVLQSKLLGETACNVARLENGPESKAEDALGQTKRYVWHDNHSFIMNLALRAVPLIQIFILITTFTEVTTRLLSTEVFDGSLLQPVALSVLCPSPKYPSRLSRLRPIPNPHKLTSPPTLFQIVAALLVVLGSRLRVRCFREMGKQFTYQHTTLTDHCLITSGPYSLVRHPSYTGVLLAYLSMVALTLTQGSWVRHCAVFPPYAYPSATIRSYLLLIFVGTVWTASVLYAIWGVAVTTGLMLRAPREDETLRARFGAEWEKYREKVSARFVPFVL